MYTPANIREFVTPATHKTVQTVTINGRTQKRFTKVATLRGKFKQKGTAIINANGLEVVHDKTSFITWWNDNLKAGDILEINGVSYTIEGQPENVEMRGRYAVVNLTQIEGGA